MMTDGDPLLNFHHLVPTSPISPCSPDLTWRDVQYLIAYTSARSPLSPSSAWVTNGGGLKVSNAFGFGVLDAEAMVTRAKRWINVPEQHTYSFQPSVPTAEK